MAARIATTPNTTLRLAIPGRDGCNVAVVMEVSFPFDYSMAKVAVKGISEQVIRWCYKDIRCAHRAGLNRHSLRNLTFEGRLRPGRFNSLRMDGDNR